MCCVCMDRQGDIVLVPCGPVCMCQQCGEQLFPKGGGRKGRSFVGEWCPLCRQAVQTVVKEVSDGVIDDDERWWVPGRGVDRRLVWVRCMPARWFRSSVAGKEEVATHKAAAPRRQHQPQRTSVARRVTGY